jgi:hypothetical protein
MGRVGEAANGAAQAPASQAKEAPVAASKGGNDSRPSLESDIKVIGAGWGRTGTHSFKKAIEILYGRTSYHMIEIWMFRAPWSSSTHCKFWSRLADGEEPNPNFDEIFDGYAASCDFPSCVFWREQLKAYPNAKVVLTMRDPESWYKSVMSTIFHIQPDGPYCKRVSNLGIRVALAFGFPNRGFSEMVRKVISRDMFGGDYSKENVIKCYNEYIESVKRDCPKDKLLVFRATDGWEPLCKFLELPVPEGEYPNTNSSAEFEHAKRALNTAGWLIMSAPLISAAAAYYYLVVKATKK